MNIHKSCSTINAILSCIRVYKLYLCPSSAPSLGDNISGGTLTVCSGVFLFRSGIYTHQLVIGCSALCITPSVILLVANTQLAFFEYRSTHTLTGFLQHVTAKRTHSWPILLKWTLDVRSNSITSTQDELSSAVAFQHLEDAFPCLLLIPDRSTSIKIC